MKHDEIRKCLVDDCSKSAAKAGYCHGHYKRLMRYGKAENPTKVCNECGKSYKATKVTQLFCSKNCKHNSKSKKLYLKYRDHAMARTAVHSEIKKGNIIRPAECELCKTSGPVEGHHHKGYAKENWLDVIWLCRICHLGEDKKHETA